MSFNKNDWYLGVESELNFWKKWLEDKGGIWSNDYDFRVDPNSELQDEIAWAIPKNFDQTFKIIDVGAGPMTYLGKNFQGKKLNITAVDALGNVYNNLHFPTGLPLIRTLQCESESLSDVYSENSFDIAFARNTLDHSYDPLKALKEMVKIIKPNGIIITIHWANEAIAGNYEGFHQWNFYIKNQCLFVGNNDLTVNVNEELKDTAELVKINPDDDSVVMCAFRKV